MQRQHPADTPRGEATRTVVVLGAGGFIGRHVVEALASRPNVRVAAAARKVTSFSGRNVTASKLDVLDQQALATFLAEVEPDCVVNCAAHGTQPSSRESGLALATNVMAPMEAYRSAVKAGADRFVQIGTCEEYGRYDRPIREVDDLRPEGVYAISKAAGTQLLIEIARNEPTELQILRPFATWGPGEAAHRLVPTLIASIAERRPVPLSDGLQIRDFALVTDVAKAIAELALAFQPTHATILNLGSGVPVSVRDFVMTVCTILGGVDLLRFGAVQRRANEMPYMAADVTRLNEHLGWLPRAFSPDVVLAMRDVYKAGA